MEDIEDLFVNQPEGVIQRLHSDKIVPRVVSKSSGEREHESEENIASSVIPGLQTVWVKTWGCAHNWSDGETMAGLLNEFGYRVTMEDTADARQRAHCWVLNSCTVKNPSEQSLLNAVDEARRLGKCVVVAGCVPSGEKQHSDLTTLSVVGVQHIDRIAEVVEETLKGNTVRLLGKKKQGVSLDLPKIRKNRFIEIIPINSGCLNQCTYCKTKHSRGDLKSYTVEEIVNRALSAISEGVLEIWLSSEDTGAYGRDIGVSLPVMLRTLLNALPDHVMLRIGMSNPPYILEHVDAIAEILRHPRVYAFMHLPLQAGSNRVLDAMRREYTKEQFCSIIDRLRELVPGITIATDVICGFPTETATEFDETLAILSKYQFPAVHISQFYARKGTPAARMKRTLTSEVKRRSRAATELFNSYTTNDAMVGKTVKVLCTEMARDQKHLVAHDKYYNQILVPFDEELLGASFDVRIEESGKFFLRATVQPGSIQKLKASHHVARYSRSPSKPSIQETQIIETSKFDTYLAWFGFICLILALICALIDV